MSHKYNVSIELKGRDIEDVKEAMNLANHIVQLSSKDICTSFIYEAAIRCSDILYERVVHPYENAVAKKIKADD
jgi:hypothetical protein